MSYNSAQKKATLKYISKLKQVMFRVKKEEYEHMQRAADLAGYKSMRAFFLDAIAEKIARIES